MRLHLPGGILKRAAADVSDITSAVRTGECYWDPAELDVLVCPFDPEPTETEQLSIRRRIVTADAADEAHLYELLDAVNDPATPEWARLTLRAQLDRYGEGA